VISRRALLLGSLATLVAPRARAGGAAVLTASEVHVAGYPTVEAIRWIGEQLAARTAGRWGLRLYDAGQLGRESDAADLARLGALDLVRLSLGSLNNAFPATRVLSLPYVFDSVDHMRRAVDGEVGASILRSFADRGLVGLAFYDSGERSVYNVRRPLRTPADLAGMKVRVPPSDIFIETVRAIGANPTPLPYGETFSALQTHLIDGAENNWPSFHTSRHFEVARFWSNTRHSCSPDVLLMSARRFEAMTPEDRALLAQIARESVGVARALWDAREQAAREAALSAGVEEVDVDLGAFRAAAAPLVESHRTDPRLDALWRAIRDLA
jgi:tripartite ATP-independent transporter DctP family solute receptor